MILWVRTGVHAQPEAPGSAVVPSGKSSEPAPATAASGPQHVTVGLYLQNIPEIDVKTNSFSAELYIWFRWRGDVDPTIGYQITNAVNVSELTQTPIYLDNTGAPSPELLPSGEHLQTFHVYGRFGHPFPLARYPFDNHSIVLSIEDAKRRVTELVHDVDIPGSGVRADLSVPGWTLSKMRIEQGETKFPTTFGDTRANPANERYSRVDFIVDIDRPWVGIVSKTVIPIALILMITFGAFFCQPGDIDARLCLTITALISAVALQITAASELPPTGSLLLLDKIYILSYATILAVTFLCIWVNRLFHAEQLERAAQVDRWGFRATIAAYFGLLVLFVVRAN